MISWARGLLFCTLGSVRGASSHAFPEFGIITYGRTGILQVVSRLPLSAFRFAEVAYDLFARSGTGRVDRLLHGSRFRKTDDLALIHWCAWASWSISQIPISEMLQVNCVDILFHTSVSEMLGVWGIEAYLTAPSKSATTLAESPAWGLCGASCCCCSPSISPVNLPEVHWQSKSCRCLLLLEVFSL